MVDLLRAEIVSMTDPENSGRVQVRSPVMGEHWIAWARVLRADSFTPPAVYREGDVVIVAFEVGDPELPIVLGVLAEGTEARTDAGCPGARNAPPEASLETGPTVDDLVLAQETRDGLRDVTTWVENERKLYGERGLACAGGPGYRVLFSGPAGSGKTMAATKLAKQLAMPICRIDLSMPISKYIGETEKNLDSVFDEAERSGAVLFFDEADALFGKRSEVKDSHDRFANLGIGYLLERIENFSGLLILAANLRNNVDPRLVTRLDSVVFFPMPKA